MNVSFTTQLPTKSALCEQGLTPQRLVSAIVAILRQHFSTANQIQDPSLRKHLYASDKTGALQIDALTAWQTPSSRPAIFVRHPDTNLEPKGMGGGQVFTSISGEQYRYVLLSGQLVVLSVCREPTEASNLASEIRRLFAAVGDIIREHLVAQRFRIRQQTGPKKVKEAADHWATAVVVDVEWYDRQVVKPVVLPATRVDLDLTNSAGESY